MTYILRNCGLHLTSAYFLSIIFTDFNIISWVLLYQSQNKVGERSHDGIPKKPTEVANKILSQIKLRRLSKTRELWSSEIYWRLRSLQPSIILAGLLADLKQEFCVFLCFKVRCLTCDRNYDWRQRKRNFEGGF